MSSSADVSAAIPPATQPKVGLRTLFRWWPGNPFVAPHDRRRPRRIALFIAFCLTTVAVCTLLLLSDGHYGEDETERVAELFLNEGLMFYCIVVELLGFLIGGVVVLMEASRWRGQHRLAELMLAPIPPLTIGHMILQRSLVPISEWLSALLGGALVGYVSAMVMPSLLPTLALVLLAGGALMYWQRVRMSLQVAGLTLLALLATDFLQLGIVVPAAIIAGLMGAVVLVNTWVGGWMMLPLTLGAHTRAGAGWLGFVCVGIVMTFQLLAVVLTVVLAFNAGEVVNFQFRDGSEGALIVFCGAVYFVLTLGPRLILMRAWAVHFERRVLPRLEL